MDKIVFVIGLVVMLAGCNSIDPNVATPNQVVLGVNAYNTAVATGTAYLKLPVCSATVSAPCRTKALSRSVYTALKSGRAARAQLLTALENNQTAPITALQALQAAYAVVSSIPQQ